MMNLSPRAARNWLRGAAIYNLAWGFIIIVWPFSLFDWAGLPRPNYPEIWQCVGMIVGVYGVGYWLASFNPNRHWPIVLVGLLGKILGPIGFVPAVYSGVFNFKFGLTILTNDLLWWIPFFILVKQGLEADFMVEASYSPPLSMPGAAGMTQGNNFIVLVRHSGCTFCRETLQQLGRHKKRILEKGFRITVIHMGAEDKEAELSQRYGLEGVHWVSDPQRHWYRYFGFRRGSWRQLFGPRVWWRGFVAGVWNGHGVGKLEGDGFQLGGIVVCQLGSCHVVHVSKDAADIGEWTAFPP